MNTNWILTPIGTDSVQQGGSSLFMRGRVIHAKFYHFERDGGEMSRICQEIPAVFAYR